MTSHTIGRIGLFTVGICATALACKETVAPECKYLELSADSLALFFREPQSITATPRGTQDALIAVPVTWTSRSPDTVTVTPTASDGSQAEVKANRIGTAILDATACGASASVVVRVLDTAYSVAVSPSSIAVTVGDTLTLTAAVTGPATVTPAVRWRNVSGLTVLAASSSDSVSVRVLVTGMSPSITARARADTTKANTPSVTASGATLAFEVQPSDVAKGATIGPAVQVSVKSTGGATSTRSVSQINLAIVNDGSCGAGASLVGPFSKSASGGVASFSNLGVTRKGSACRISATALPAATAAVSAGFAVAARACAPVTMTPIDTVAGTLESGDCPVQRGGATYNTHVYGITVPTGGSQAFRITYTGAFAPRIESSLWAPSSVSLVDSEPANAPLTTVYALGEGTHVLSLGATQAGPAGDYSLATALLGGGVSAAPCRVVISWGARFGDFPFGQSCTGIGPGGEIGRRYFTYLPAGESVTVSLVPTSNADISFNISVYDITNTRTLVDTRTGGIKQTVQFTLSSAPTHRWIEFATAAVAGSGVTLHTFSIK